MLKDSSDNHNKNIYPENTSIPNENNFCKDGFCSLPNQEEISKKDKKDINLFDPI